MRKTEQRGAWQTLTLVMRSVLWEAFLFQTMTAVIHNLYPSFVNKLPPECRAILPHWRHPDQSGRCTVLWLLGSSLWWPPGHTESAWECTGDQRTLSPGTCPPCSRSRSRPQLCCLGTGSDESPEAGQKMQVDKRTASHLDQSWKLIRKVTFCLTESSLTFLFSCPIKV